MAELTYTMQGDYNLPDLTMPEQPEVTMGRYAQMRKKYLKEQHRILYYNLLTSCTLTAHLVQTEQTALQMEESLLKKMAAQEGLTESLKAADTMKWVQGMNNLRNRVQEIVKAEVIFA
ncbi:MAG: TnpV protein [Acutalibacteraceae bacterium]